MQELINEITDIHDKTFFFIDISYTVRDEYSDLNKSKRFLNHEHLQAIGYLIAIHELECVNIKVSSFYPNTLTVV